MNTPVSEAAGGTTTFTYSFEKDGEYVSSLSSLTKTEVGSYTIYVKATNPNYAGTAETTAQLTINRTGEKFTISLAGSTYTYDATAKAITNTPKSTAASGTTTFTYSFTKDGEYVSSLSSLTKTDAGTYTVYVKATNPNYSEGAETTAELKINKRDVKITWSGDTHYRYDGKVHGVTATVTGLVGSAKYTVSGNSATDIGNYVARVSFSGTGNNYNLPTNTSCAWEIVENPAEFHVKNEDGNIDECKVIEKDTDTLDAHLSDETNIENPVYTWYRKYPDGDWELIPGSETRGGYDSEYKLTEDDVGAWIKCMVDDPLIKGPVEASEIAFVPLYFTQGMGQTYDSGLEQRTDAITVEAGTGQDAPFATNGKYARFDYAMVDGERLDESNYYTAEGCTLINLRSAYLDTLSETRHTLTAVYIDGNSCDTDFYVKFHPDVVFNGDRHGYGPHVDSLLPFLAMAVSYATQFWYYGRKKKYTEKIEELKGRLNGIKEQ